MLPKMITPPGWKLFPPLLETLVKLLVGTSSENNYSHKLLIQKAQVRIFNDPIIVRVCKISYSTALQQCYIMGSS